MRRTLKVVILALSICYPFMVYWGLQHFDTLVLLLLLLALLLARWALGERVPEKRIVIATLVGVVAIALIWGQQLGLKFYPVIINFCLLTVFLGSLFSPPTIVEQLARIREPDLPPDAISYIRKVTWMWSVFFLLNGSIAAVTAVWGSDEAWMLYNGFIAYLLVGGLAGGEWLVRQWVKRC
ncbi:MAG: hypothetical protein DRQ61_11515 [Gammaproteobacteria bacterium]|nr:MAG: hypothetical protein DRQ61_11515 [Gammaproteobacteria bacterium]RLA52680.1 MAG: hypothetical protein DRR42_06895 [Gammaproteobacteria bacterium]